MKKITFLQSNPTFSSTQLCPITTPAVLTIPSFPAYSCSLGCSNVISFVIPRKNCLGLYSFRGFSKRSNVVKLTRGSFWEDPDDGTDSENDEKEYNEDEDEDEDEDGDENEMEEKGMDVKSRWDYGAENESTASPTDELSEDFVKEVEQLLSPEERAVLDRNQTPDLAKMSTAKWNPLHTFALAGQIRFMDRLLEEGVDIDVVDKEGQTALHHAIIAKKEAVISHILRKGANPQVRDLCGVTPLHYAVQVSAIQTVKLLIKCRVDVNVADNDGWTPLHVAMQSRNRDIAKILLVNGADKYRKNKDGNTPLDLSLCYGKEFKSYDLARLLKVVPANREM